MDRWHVDSIEKIQIHYTHISLSHLLRALIGIPLHSFEVLYRLHKFTEMYKTELTFECCRQGGQDLPLTR